MATAAEPAAAPRSVLAEELATISVLVRRDCTRFVREKSRVVGALLQPLIFWLVMLVVILLASTALGLESINQMFGMMLAFIPTLIAAIVIIILGMIVGEFVRGLILASAGGVAGVPTVAKIAKGAVIVIALFMALQQVGVAEEIVTAAFTLILGAVALAVGLAFGLGNRELAGEITRRWYEEGQRRDRRRTDRQGPNTPPGGEPPILD